MIEIRRILCPIDFSDFSRRALDHAVVIARWYESTITLVHVSPIVPLAAYAPGSGVVPSANLSPEERAALLASLKEFAAPDAAAGVPFDYQLTEGRAAAQILNAAETLSSDLIVMGTHGRSGFERMILGSVTEKVLRKAACPVLSVPRSSLDVVPVPPLFKRILCAVDFSDCSMQGLHYAMSLAQEADASLTVLHVIDLPPEVSDVQGMMVGGAVSFQDYIAQAGEDRRKRLKDAVPDAVREHCHVETVLATGTPYREVLRVAAEQTSDLIVIGLHGRGPVDLLFFGSTAQQVVRSAPCPVLTLRK
ncbi:MAG TPA: universal stress protein [Vicinamibacterales bacterium]|nr:universal stress protein [Vicinamibacterales bacterium]